MQYPEESDLVASGNRQLLHMRSSKFILCISSIPIRAHAVVAMQHAHRAMKYELSNMGKYLSCMSICTMGEYTKHMILLHVLLSPSPSTADVVWYGPKRVLF